MTDKKIEMEIVATWTLTTLKTWIDENGQDEREIRMPTFNCYFRSDMPISHWKGIGIQLINLEILGLPEYSQKHDIFLYPITPAPEWYEDATLKAYYSPIADKIQKSSLRDGETLGTIEKYFYRREKEIKRISQGVCKIIADVLTPIFESEGYSVTVITEGLYEEIKDDFPLVKVDRATVQNLLVILINKEIFTDYTNVPTKDSILDKEMKRLNKSELSFQEKRTALSRAEKYRDEHYIMRDYGDYAIGFSTTLYSDYLRKTEIELEETLQQKPYMFPAWNDRINQALKRIKLYRLAHKLSCIVLAEVYTQEKYKDVAISKQKIINYLGKTTGDKEIYKEIKDAFYSLRWCDYILFDYNYTDTKREHKKERGRSVGNFIYNLKETSKEYILDINDKFVGCVSHLWEEKIKSAKKRKEIFSRGYFDYSTKALPLTVNYSTPAYLLTTFLMMERGNRKLRKRGFKVIRYRGNYYCKKLHIEHSRASKRWEVLLRAIKEVDIIKEINPPLKQLETLSPGNGLKTLITLYVLSPARVLDNDIKEILGQRKSNI